MLLPFVLSLSISAAQDTGPDSGTADSSGGDTADTSDTGTALVVHPAWTAVLLDTADTVDQRLSLINVAVVDDEAWSSWGVSTDTTYGHHAARVIGETVTSLVVAGRPNEGGMSTTVATHPSRDKVAILRMVACDPLVHTSCTGHQPEMEIVFVDRTTLDQSPVDILVPTVVGLAKGRGHMVVGPNKLNACFKANYPQPLKDEVICAEMDQDGKWKAQNISGLTDGGDDHPSVAYYQGKPFVFFSSARASDKRSTWYASEGVVDLLMDVTVKSEEPMVITVDDALHATWWERRATEDVMVYATCNAADCTPTTAWTVEDAITGDYLRDPSVAFVDGVPALSYVENGRSHVAYKCADEWVVEVPFDFGEEHDLHGAPSSLAASVDGSLHLAVIESAELDQAWYVRRDGPLCP